MSDHIHRVNEFDNCASKINSTILELIPELEHTDYDCKLFTTASQSVNTSYTIAPSLANMSIIFPTISSNISSYATSIPLDDLSTTWSTDQSTDLSDASLDMSSAGPETVETSIASMSTEGPNNSSINTPGESSTLEVSSDTTSLSTLGFSIASNTESSPSASPVNTVQHTPDYSGSSQNNQAHTLGFSTMTGESSVVSNSPQILSQTTPNGQGDLPQSWSLKVSFFFYEHLIGSSKPVTCLFKKI